MSVARVKLNPVYYISRERPGGRSLAMVDTESTRQIAEDIASTVDAEEIAGILARLVRIPSVYDPDTIEGNERRVADFVAGLLESWGLDYDRWDVVAGRPNIVADIRGGPGPVIVFEGHMDVVTAGDPGLWSHDPFGAQVVDGSMFGRGTADMKGGLTAMLVAAKEIAASRAEFPGTIRLAILSDEEGMMQGARSFVERGYLDEVVAAIICEPEGGRVCTAQKGALRIGVEFHGAMAHGCMPDEGANPVAALGECIVALRQLEAGVVAEREPHPLLGRFSISPTVVRGGTEAQANVIPATATLMLDVRTCPEHRHPELIERIRSVCQTVTGEIAGTSVTVHMLDDRPATETPIDDPIVAAARMAHRREFGVEPEIGGVPGSTDGTIFWMERKTPLVTWGPGDVTIPHQVNEFVRLDEVAAYCRAYVRAALEYFDDASRTK